MATNMSHHGHGEDADQRIDTIERQVERQQEHLQTQFQNQFGAQLAQLRDLAALHREIDQLRRQHRSRPGSAEAYEREVTALTGELAELEQQRIEALRCQIEELRRSATPRAGATDNVRALPKPAQNAFHVNQQQIARTLGEVHATLQSEARHSRETAVQVTRLASEVSDLVSIMRDSASPPAPAPVQMPVSVEGAAFYLLRWLGRYRQLLCDRKLNPRRGRGKAAITLAEEINEHIGEWEATRPTANCRDILAAPERADLLDRFNRLGDPLPRLGDADLFSVQCQRLAALVALEQDIAIRVSGAFADDADASAGAAATQ